MINSESFAPYPDVIEELPQVERETHTPTDIREVMVERSRRAYIASIEASALGNSALANDYSELAERMLTERSRIKPGPLSRP